MPTQSTDPRTGNPFGPEFADTSQAELDHIVGAAADTAHLWADTSVQQKVAALQSIADALDKGAADLVPLADRETGLGEARLVGELGRTTFQLRMFAGLVGRGEHSGIVMDPAVPGPAPQGRPEIRRMLIPVGPVAVYGASNFPFAFSVAGGDTASALAAGCPVVVKAHPGHPQTSEAVAEKISAALVASGTPEGVFGLVRGIDAGRRLVQHPAVRAAAFTGSYAGGRALFDLAVSRPDPIPFYGELGSVNPAIVTPLAAQRGKPLAIEYLDSLTLGTGQFCTNPGLLLIPAGSGLTQLIADEADTRQPGVMLHAGIAELFRRNVAHLAALPGVRAPVNGSTVNAPGTWSGPTILAADQHAATANPELLHTECFGPAAIVIEYASEQGLLELISRLEGCLVATVHGNENEPIAAAVVQRLARITGRVVWNDWPTGVAVTAAQHHGGPHPATTNSLHTSVGDAAVLRFLRPVAYQSVPNALLPRALRETPDNQPA